MRWTRNRLTNVIVGSSLVIGILEVIFPIYVEKPRNSNMLNILSTLNFEEKTYSNPILVRAIQEKLVDVT